MRNYSMPEQEAARKICPANRRDWRQLAGIFGFFAVAVLALTVFLHLKRKHREDVEQNWQSATAIIEDVRTNLTGKFDSQLGGAMLYDMQVLVKYEVNGDSREKWVTLQRPAETLQYAKLDAFRWKGKQCVVRWKSSNPDQLVADVN